MPKSNDNKFIKNQNSEKGGDSKHYASDSDSDEIETIEDLFEKNMNMHLNGQFRGFIFSLILKE